MPALGDAIQEYLDSRTARRIAAGTVKNERSRLKQFRLSVGEIQVSSIDGSHVDKHWARHPGYSAGTFNQHRNTLNSFFEWCQARRYMPKDAQPLAGVTHINEPLRERIFVPVERFPETLDAAKDPRDRIIAALGLYLFTGAAEMKRMLARHIHIQDSNSENWYAQVWRQKTGKYEDLPVCEELGEELRRWKFTYASQAGSPVSDNWHIVPAYHVRKWESNRNKGQGIVELGGGVLPPKRINPTRPYGKPEQAVHRILLPLGYDETFLEGNHTFRRSGGLALYNELAWNRGHDGAIRIVQFMFMHESIQTTERYLRLSLERKRSFDLLAGKRMHLRPEGKVIDLDQAK